jgi:hypothetical protein
MLSAAATLLASGEFDRARLDLSAARSAFSLAAASEKLWCAFIQGYLAHKESPPHRSLQ